MVESVLSPEVAFETVSSSEASRPRWMNRLGWFMSALTILFLLFDGLSKLAMERHVVASSIAIGYSVGSIRPIGMICLACTALYVIPRTSLLGAVLLTGYLGGAVASKIRIEDPLFSSVLFGVYIGVFIWGGLYLRGRIPVSIMRSAND